MTVYDQYETETTSVYTGSYGSSLLLERTTIFTTGSFNRAVVADAAMQTFYTGALFQKKYLASDYPGIYNAVKNSYVTRKSFSRYNQSTCADEQYHDSVIAHPLQYAAANQISGGLLLTNGFAFQDTDAHTVLGMPALAPSSSIWLFVGTSSCRVYKTDTEGPMEEMCDNIWNYTGPFQSRYKNVFRLKRPSFRTPFVGRTTVSQVLNSGNPRRNTWFLTSSFDAIGILSFVTQSGASDQIPAKFIFMADEPLSGTATSLTNGFVPSTAPQMIVPNMSPKILYSTFFGFGDGEHNFPKPVKEIGVNGIIYAFVPQIRGWKYGLVDGQPKFSTAIFRYGKFGQFRDMLEQRPFTKFYTDDTPLEAAIQVRFLTSSQAYSRSLDYVTASAPSYDPRDTGFYDFEYRCGHPFVDVEPTD